MKPWLAGSLLLLFGILFMLLSGNCDLTMPKDMGPPDQNVVRDMAFNCNQGGMCNSPDLPLCAENGRCSPCNPDGSPGMDAGDPACARFVSRKRCGSKGTCVECITSGDCADGGACIGSACQPCGKDGDCESMICESDRCIPEKEIIYVSNQNAPVDECKMLDGGPGDGSRQRPYCSLAEAIPVASPGRPHIHVAKSQAAYDRIADGSMTVDVVIVGQDHPVISPTIFSAINVATSHALTVRGFDLKSQGASVVVCKGRGTINLVGCRVHDSLKFGIDTFDCNVSVVDSVVENNAGGGVKSAGDMGNLSVDRSRVRYNRNLGIQIVNDGTFNVTNTFITDNPIANGSYAFDFRGSGTGIFAFNTVARNGRGLLGWSAVNCEPKGLTIWDSIIVDNVQNNRGEQLSSGCVGQTSWTGATSAGDMDAGQPMFVDVDAGDYRLLNNAATRACCIGQARKPNEGGGGGVYEHDIDNDRRPCPMQQDFDRGADQVCN